MGLANRGLVALWLVAVPVLAVSAFLWLSQPPEPFAAEVVGSSVTQTDEGLVGEVRWVDEDGGTPGTELHPDRRADHFRNCPAGQRGQPSASV